VRKLRTVIPIDPSGAAGWRLAINLNGDISTTSSGTAIYAISNAGITTYSLTGASAMDSIWSTYRIAAIKFRYFPEVNVEQVDGTATGVFSPFYITYDSDGHEIDITAANVADMIASPKVTVKNMFRPWSYYVKTLKYPIRHKYPMANPNDSITTNNVNMAGQWHSGGNSIGTLPTAYSSHIHMLTTCPSGQNSIGRMVVTAYVTYKDIYTS